MMKKLMFIFIFVYTLPSVDISQGVSVTDNVVYGQSKNSKKRVQKSRAKKRPRKKRRSNAAQVNKLNNIEQMIEAGSSKEALEELYKIRRSFRFRSFRTRIYYLMGKSFYNLGLYQASAFQFGMVVSAGKSDFLIDSLNKLEHVSTDILHSNAMLNYALSKVRLSNFPKEYQNKLRLIISEVYLGNKQYDNAIKILDKVERSSQEYYRAKYIQSLSYAEKNSPKRAFREFRSLQQSRSDAEVTDVIKVNATLGMARSAYQAKNWKRAVSLYRQIPRDTPQWHDSLFELSWAQMRAAQFRSALSNFHSLHSPYYDEMYQPESLILRSIIYLYICKHDELDKVLTVFQKTYNPIKDKLVSYTKARKRPKGTFDTLYNVHKQYKMGLKVEDIKSEIPVVVALAILREPLVKNYIMYAERLENEQEILTAQAFASNALQRYVSNMLRKRLDNTKKSAGRVIMNNLRQMRAQIIELSDQYDFIRYEMLGAKKEAVQKEALEGGNSTIDAKMNRDFYVKNGYEYWPFKGEYWLDEIGNYYFLGTSSCE